MRRCRRTVLAVVSLVVGGGWLIAPGPAARAAGAVSVSSGPGPAAKYDCRFDVQTDAFTGAHASASAIGWAGNQQGVVTCLGGTFLVQDGQYQYRDYGFALYDGARTTWTDADGYLPAQITTFRHSGALVSITEFADRLVLGGHPYVAVYSRVAVSNPTTHVVLADPGASAGMVQLHAAPVAVPPHRTVDHDYVVIADRFGHRYPWPGARALAGAGSFTAHFAHMRGFWNRQLAGIAEVRLPDRTLEDAYRSGFIYTQIARSGTHLNTGINGYGMEFSHDVVGILTNLFTQGYDTGAHALLLRARDVMGPAAQYNDGVWTYSLPWAVYLLKTGDVAFVKANFDTEGPKGAAQPSIEDTAHQIAAARTGTGGIMEATNDIDTQGYWTTDDYEALLGLAAYRYIAQRVGHLTEAAWATREYDSLLAATDAALAATIDRYHLDYLPCSISQPNTANRCANPEDANWVSPFGNWAWAGSLLGAAVTGPGASLIDATYDYGFARLKGKLPADTFGGFPDDYYTSGYNAANGSAGLAGRDHRDQGIANYQFLIANDQSGPYSWWESSTAPAVSSPWVGRHPTAGQGSSPHAWGMAGANKVLLDSLVAQSSNGDLIVGRGVPPAWLEGHTPIAVENFPTTGDRRLSLQIRPAGRSVSLSLSGPLPSGPVLFQLPSFIGNLSHTSAGTMNGRTGTVTIPRSTRRVIVTMRTSPGS